MTEMLREQLSALADDELDNGEMELLVRQYAGNAELRARWSMYHVIGEAIRRGRPGHGAWRLADRVSAALDLETAQPATGQRHDHATRRWLKILRPIGAAAVAASVGVVAVLVVRSPAPNELATVPPAEVVPPQPRAPRMGFNYEAVSSVRWDQGSPQVRRELNEYLFDHNEDAPALGRQGMLPYVHMATFLAAEPAGDQAPRRAATQLQEGNGE
ncbi:MAG TPA: sigma-E factor negative regulatory protein [Gammaproteobacteria bacterium]|nr:sigma-E factor negative regulatory protein [Gammaproteobacteria bacterium]